MKQLFRRIRGNLSMFMESFSMSVANITQNRMRSFLTVLGITIGVTAVIALITTISGVSASISNSFTSMGAGSIKVFTSVTLPLISDSFFSSLVSTFARSITATSAVIFLISARWQLITPQIMTVVDRGQYSVACAYATIMMFIVYAAIALMNLLVSRMRRRRRVKEQKAVAGT